jgi:hypothetical protein
MKIIPTLSALALAALASNASAELISYEFDLNPICLVFCPPPVINGYITIDDALMQSHGSGDLVAWDLEFNQTLTGCTFGFGYRCGNNFFFFVPGPPPMSVSGHFSHLDAVVTFADGVPVAMSYSEQHAYDPKGWSMLEIRPTAGSFFYPSATWKLDTYSSTSVGTYSFGPQIPVVPEPETWALLVAGLGAVGVVRRKSRGA